MTMTNLAPFWEEVIKRAKSTIPADEFEVWFVNVKYVSSGKGFILLGVPSLFYKEQVEKRYLVFLKQTLLELSGMTIAIRFEIQPPSSLSGDPVEDSTKKEPDLLLSPPHPQLSETYTFEGFIIGKNNSFAANASLAIAKNPGVKYNPCLIYGGVGLGKTHLLHSIGNYIYRKDKKQKIICVTAENFVTDFIQSIKNDSQPFFKNKYRTVDVLLIDDIHDFQNKRETQEELFFTFNSLYDSNKQMVFTCDRPISEVKDFTDRLRSRFERGLNVDLQPPSYETTYAILKKKLETSPVHIGEEILELISREVTTNIRDVEAALTKLSAYSELVGKELTLDVARRQLKSFFSSCSPFKISIHRIQRVVSEYFDVSVSDLKSKKRTKNIAFSRQISMYIAREITDYSTTEIGLEYGGRDHSTVMHSYQKIEECIRTDPNVSKIVQDLIKNLKEKEEKL